MSILNITALVITLSGLEIMKKVDSQPLPQSSISTVKMIISKGGDTRERKIIIYTKREGDKRFSATKFLEPADVKDTEFLQISDEKGETNQWLYLPSLKRSRRIAGAQKKTSFMGSEITYEDMERKIPEEYNHNIISEDEKMYVIESTPIKDKDSQYSKAVFYIRKEDLAVIKTELYDKNGKKIKVIENEVKKIENKYNIPIKTTVKNLENGNYTEMIVEEIKVDVPVDKKIFSPDFLGQW